MASQTNSNLPARHLCVHPDAHHNDNESRSSTIHEQIDLYLSATALILDAALRDFKHDQKQQHLSHDQHNNTDHDTDSTYNHSDGHLDKDPTVLTLDDALNNFRYTADQHPSHDTPDQHDTAVVTIPPPPHQQRASTSHNPHADRITVPQRRITRSMTAAAQQRNTVSCIIDTTDTNTHIPHETPPTTTTDGWPDWHEDPNNSGISWYGTIAPQRTRPTVCIPDTDNTPAKI